MGGLSRPSSGSHPHGGALSILQTGQHLPAGGLDALSQGQQLPLRRTQVCDPLPFRVRLPSQKGRSPATQGTHMKAVHGQRTGRVDHGPKGAKGGEGAYEGGGSSVRGLDFGRFLAKIFWDVSPLKGGQVTTFLTPPPSRR